MDKQQVSGSWKQLKGKIKEKWGQLTDDEIEESQGKWDQLAGRIERAHGLSRDEARRQLDALMGRKQ